MKPRNQGKHFKKCNVERPCGITLRKHGLNLLVTELHEDEHGDDDAGASSGQNVCSVIGLIANPIVFGWKTPVKDQFYQTHVMTFNLIASHSYKVIKSLKT